VRASLQKLSRDNDYSLEAIERDLLTPANLRFVRDDAGNIADKYSDRSGVEGSLAVEAVKEENYTPEQLYRALQDAKRAEKEYMKTGKRDLAISDNKTDNIDRERAKILANLLINESLEKLAARGLHGRAAGDRMKKVDAVADLLYKTSYGRDLYTGSPIIGAKQDAGHLESNSRGGVRLRPELALINQMLGDTEGVERLKRIDEAQTRIDAAGNYTDEILEDEDIKRLLKYKDFQNMVDKQQTRKAQYGFESGEDLQATGQVVGEKPIVVNADEGANVYVHTNGNGNGHTAVQREFNRRQR
tara:strand:- start:1997 stop:2902 length:906 start_codon:yes stop_codon:yes gene_type:complete